jgi:hypothetical protein
MDDICPNSQQGGSELAHQPAGTTHYFVTAWCVQLDILRSPAHLELLTHNDNNFSYYLKYNCHLEKQGYEKAIGKDNNALLLD